MPREKRPKNAELPESLQGQTHLVRARPGPPRPRPRVPPEPARARPAGGLLPRTIRGGPSEGLHPFRATGCEHQRVGGGQLRPAGRAVAGTGGPAHPRCEWAKPRGRRAERTLACDASGPSVNTSTCSAASRESPSGADSSMKFSVLVSLVVGLVLGI